MSRACERIRSGTPADELKAINIANGPLAAHHEFCPDTL